MSTVFKEEQKFNQWWLWIILLGIAVIPVVGIYKQLIKGKEFGDNPMPDLVLIIFAIFIFGILTLLWTVKLKTEINKYEIRFRFFPFFAKRIDWKEVKSAEVVNYGFVGGWGIRLSIKYGTVYNVRGNKGLAIVLNNGQKLLIGTQKEHELSQVLSEIRSRKTERYD